MKVGVIDLGSNTSKLLIAQKKPFLNHQNFKTLKEKSLPCRIFSLTEKKVLKIPKEVELLDTSYDEKQAFAREIDRQKRKEDPTYQGAFHDRKKAALKNPNKANHKTIQAYKFIAEEGNNHKNKGKGKGKSKAKVPKPKRKGKKR